MLSNNTINDITDNIIIDNTLIINKYGSEQIGYGNGICRKKYTSLKPKINNQIMKNTELEQKLLKIGLQN